ncbi:TPA: response regulator [Pseudomonas putida]|jgi:DNA-binding response OmpR family regulator|uniref:Response regulator receiver protein n=1 Tax=Pseudomonas putida (strain GB-1) TaxID=76869 RepID=B0KMI6_PSEPG|nr:MULTISPECIES: response regulator [Pseudomonas]ABY98042.1 response regulator receiver protein [Pseudomonas putida GB-1]APE98405.1 response regulator [Pseudomonas putida]MBP0711169.1 response regulator [Pseudomonas sp. T34]MCE1003299.1 response regulator [Pseudomonas sp. NMI1173_11]MCK2190621.1 response regulator [Pseudomonas sp. MB04B]
MHLLVVEDDDIVRMLMVEVLDELGYNVIEAEDAAAALRVLEDPNQALALMMTDVGLPDMRGELLAGKARELRPLLPVLFASGYADSFNVPEGMHLIGKPFSIDQLRDKVVAILGNP